LNYHAIEVGPVTVDWFESHYRKGGLQELAKAHPNLGLAVPFISNIEDAELSAKFIRSEDSKNLWGIDQEFIGAPLILLEELVRIAKNDAAMLISASVEDFTTLKSLNPENIVAQKILCK